MATSVLAEASRSESPDRSGRRPAARSDRTTGDDPLRPQHPAAGELADGFAHLPRGRRAGAGSIAEYYGRAEPSSPALPLVRQAHQLIGKSFLEIITVLVPSHVDQAAFQIGTAQVFDLPVNKISFLSANPADIEVSVADGVALEI